MNPEEFHKEFGSKYYRLVSQVNREYAQNLKEIYFRGIDFLYKVVTVIALFAGFGFTAMSEVQNVLVFSLGELLLVFGIVRGIFWVQNIYNLEHKNLAKAFNKHNEAFREREKVYKKILFDFLGDNHPSKTSMEELLEKNKEIERSFKNDEGSRENLERDIYPKDLYFLFIAGTIILLISFVWNDFVDFFGWFIDLITTMSLTV